MDGFNNQQVNNAMMQNQDYRVPPNWNMPVMPPWMFYNNPQMNTPWFNNQGNNLQMSNEPVRNNTTPTNQASQPVPQTNARQTIPCGIVANMEDIKPGEIPMDGGIGMFLLSDLSEICIKRWNSDGKIQTKRYVEHIEDEMPLAASETPSVDTLLQDFLDTVNKRFERVERMISSLAEASSNKKPSVKKVSPKTEVSTNE